MASLHRDPRGKSPFFSCAFTHADGQTRAFKSTKKTQRKEADEICRGWQRAVDLAKQGELTETSVHKLAAEICERAKVVMPKYRAFIGQVLGEICEMAGGERVQFATVEGFLKGWVDAKKLARASGTASRYGHSVDLFLTQLGARAKRSLSSVTPRDIENFRNEQVKLGKANKTVNMDVKTLRIAFNLARRQGLILSNPAEAVETLPENSATRRTFTPDEVKSLLTVADTEWRGMILIGAYHSLRLGDAARLTMANWDGERRSLRFIQQKERQASKRELEIPLHPDVEDYLLSLASKSRKPDVPIFPTLSKKKMIGDSGLSSTFVKLIAKAGIVRQPAGGKVHGQGRQVYDLSFHSFRHTGISALANAGVSKERRMRLTGHKSDVHERYTHHELEILRSAVEMVPSLVKPR